MAAGWVAALKLVPWGDVIEATPQILQAAKKLLGTTRKGNAEAAAGALEGAGGEPAIPVALQLEHLRERVAMLEQEQQESAVLIQSLAEAGVALSDPGGSGSLAWVPIKNYQAVVNAAEACPGECIFIELPAQPIGELAASA